MTEDLGYVGKMAQKQQRTCNANLKLKWHIKAAKRLLKVRQLLKAPEATQGTEAIYRHLLYIYLQSESYSDSLLSNTSRMGYSTAT